MAARNRKPVAASGPVGASNAVAPWRGVVLVSGVKDAAVPAGHGLVHANGRRYRVLEGALVGAGEEPEEVEVVIEFAMNGDGDGALEAGEILTFDPLVDGLESEVLVHDPDVEPTAAAAPDGDSDSDRPPATAGDPADLGTQCTFDVLLQGPQRVQVPATLTDVKNGRGTVRARLPDGRVMTKEGVVVVPASRRNDADVDLELPRAIVG